MRIRKEKKHEDLWCKDSTGTRFRYSSCSLHTSDSARLEEARGPEFGIGRGCRLRNDLRISSRSAPNVKQANPFPFEKVASVQDEVEWDEVR
jgi:hypothetical protein